LRSYLVMAILPGSPRMSWTSVTRAPGVVPPAAAMAPCRLE